MDAKAKKAITADAVVYGGIILIFFALVGNFIILFFGISIPALDLWESPELPPHTVLMVTHNVDEAVQMSDRIIVLSRRPSKVIEAKRIDLPRPRNTRSEEFYRTVDEVLTIMSS